MTKYDLIKELMELVDEYWANPTQINRSVPAFCKYINAMDKAESNHFDYISQSLYKHASLGYLFGKMCRYGRYYNKELLKYTDFSTPEEFGLAASLIHGKTPKKSELLHREVIEVPTGMAIIKRLVAKGVLMEISDADDKRALRIGLTPYGRQKVLEAFEVLAPLNEALSGPLSEEEITTLIEILHKLDVYHHENHSSIREKFAELYDKEQKT